MIEDNSIDHPDDRNTLDYTDVMITLISLMIPTHVFSFGRSPRAKQILSSQKEQKLKIQQYFFSAYLLLPTYRAVPA